MLNKDIIKGILLDYGGTIDTNGLHWGIVLWEQYQKLAIPVTNEQFNEAYVHGERSLALHPYIKPEHNFFDVLLIKSQIQIDYLIEKNYVSPSIKELNFPQQIAQACYNFSQDVIEQAKPTLDYLSKKFPVILVSNFYGNIQAVLNDFGIGQYFQEIVESAVVGVRKPDPAIWKMGVDKLNVQPNEAVVIGDSYTKDIVSGKNAGFQIICFDVSGWDKLEDVSQADEIITNFTALKILLNKK